ncbi:MAG: AMP-binding protein [Candidatus Neomarinimicrobiota bacterium]|jgi:long-subunit acyl-CoA synthetase (AMP-forming)|nr:AMP-binding protein [Candidatus Neomarinimicrobiota bacterium]HJM69322.1 AMP-binding protein [Candidatus Neomarinimicrobiota bacterium]|tara:strand:- start:260 stop:1972 length:1713 start_codon:yes stop_codon:yes gene_type:complete
MMVKIVRNDADLPEFPQNLATMLEENAENYSTHPVYQEIINGEYEPLAWSQFIQDISSIQFYLFSIGFKEGDHLAILSVNRKEMLELELAVMSMGGRVVPIFPGYKAEKVDKLVNFCDADYIAVADDIQYCKISEPDKFKKIIHFDNITYQGDNLIQFNNIVSNCSDQRLKGAHIDKKTVCLMMYTSGTMGTPKLVQLTHENILSQQAAMKVLWNLKSTDRFLSYLPWHHSFGGIYEKYSAICNGAVFSLDNSYGKDINQLISNWRKVKPTVFFSVPRIYQALATLMRQSVEMEKLIFHDELRFIFTAAAPLPKHISDIFASKNVPVYEGWGLTETSPCCTVTNPDLFRSPGVVGKPIPGVSLQLSEEGEILVKGPNVMSGYYHNTEETENVFLPDGWFRTGDVGEINETGLKLISRIDRIFKLSNAEKVIPTEIENILYKDCAYMAHAFVTGSGKDYPVVLVFPNKGMFNESPDPSQLMEGCKCPKNLDEYFHCLKNCLVNWNDSIETKYSILKKAQILDYELSIENEELTPSMKLAPNVVGRVFKAEIESLYQSNGNKPKPVYIVNVE